ncbi:hypothetical protein BC828DRAFT_79516 [Blastocladiella britannica]|nr:hypothetical protein BC828DRAFT_79516 [Blastocladiella britannica]
MDPFSNIEFSSPECWGVTGSTGTFDHDRPVACSSSRSSQESSALGAYGKASGADGGGTSQARPQHPNELPALPIPPNSTDWRGSVATSFHEQHEYAFPAMTPTPSPVLSRYSAASASEQARVGGTWACVPDFEATYSCLSDMVPWHMADDWQSFSLPQSVSSMDLVSNVDLFDAEPFGRFDFDRSLSTQVRPQSPPMRSLNPSTQSPMHPVNLAQQPTQPAQPILRAAARRARHAIQSSWSHDDDGDDDDDEVDMDSSNAGNDSRRPSVSGGASGSIFHGGASVTSPPAAAPFIVGDANEDGSQFAGSSTFSYERMILAALDSMARKSTEFQGAAPREIYAEMQELFGPQLPKHFTGSATQALKKGMRKRLLMRCNKLYMVNPNYDGLVANGRLKPNFDKLRGSDTQSSSHATANQAHATPRRTQSAAVNANRAVQQSACRGRSGTHARSHKRAARRVPTRDEHATTTTAAAAVATSAGATPQEPSREALWTTHDNDDGPENKRRRLSVASTLSFPGLDADTMGYCSFDHPAASNRSTAVEWVPMDARHGAAAWESSVMSPHAFSDGTCTLDSRYDAPPPLSQPSAPTQYRHHFDHPPPPPPGVSSIDPLLLLSPVFEPQFCPLELLTPPLTAGTHEFAHQQHALVLPPPMGSAGSMSLASPPSLPPPPVAVGALTASIAPAPTSNIPTPPEFDLLDFDTLAAGAATISNAELDALLLQIGVNLSS